MTEEDLFELLDNLENLQEETMCYDEVDPLDLPYDDIELEEREEEDYEEDYYDWPEYWDNDEEDIYDEEQHEADKIQ